MNKTPPPDSATLGDVSLFNQPKIAFLSSRRLPSAAIIKTYEWAQQARARKTCVISGFHSVMERDVWDILIKGQSPLIKVCARSLPKRVTLSDRPMIEKGRLLIVSPFPGQPRPTQRLTHLRNLFVLNNADQIIIPHHPTPDGRLATTLKEYTGPTPITYLVP